MIKYSNRKYPRRLWLDVTAIAGNLNRYIHSRTIFIENITIKHSWFFKEDFNKARHLFSGIYLEYDIVIYSCKCGFEHIMIVHKEDKHNYSCKNCSNSFFFDANNAQEHPSFFLHQFEKKISIPTINEWETLHRYEYDFNFLFNKIKKQENTLTLSYGFYVPTHSDFLREKVLYKFVDVCIFGIDTTGKLIQEYLIEYDEEVFDSLHTKFLSELNMNRNLLAIPSSTKEKITLKIAKFFFKHQDVTEFDFLYWQESDKLDFSFKTIEEALYEIANFKKAKSIKKVIYSNYTQQISQNQHYVWSVEHLLSRVVDNVNILVRALEIMFNFAYTEYPPRSISHIEELIVYMLEHKTNKNFLLFLESFVGVDTMQNIDLLNDFIFCKELSCLGSLEKPSSNARKLHDQMIELARMERQKEQYETVLVYLEEALSYQMQFDDYKVVLPLKGATLFRWADEMHNCLSSYINAIRYDGTTIYAFYKKEKLDFAVEYEKGRGVIQASSKYNIQLDEIQTRTLEKWLKKIKEKDLISTFAPTYPLS